MWLVPDLLSYRRDTYCATPDVLWKFRFCEVERLSNKQSLQISRGNKPSLNEIQVQEVSIFSRRKLLRKKKEVSLLLLFSLFHLQ